MSTPSMSGNGLILLVEDNADDEALILRALQKAGVGNHIEVVRDGAEALDFLFRRGVHAGRPPVMPVVTLLDINLPKVGGLEVLEAVRADCATAHLAVVMLSSSDEEEDVLRSYALDANSYVRKPVEFNRFSAVISQLGLYWLLLNERMPARG